MAAVGGELKAKTSFFTVLCLALAFWQGLSAVNADATGEKSRVDSANLSNKTSAEGLSAPFQRPVERGS